jgi:hypothetical protein
MKLLAALTLAALLAGCASYHVCPQGKCPCYPYSPCPDGSCPNDNPGVGCPGDAQAQGTANGGTP